MATFLRSLLLLVSTTLHAQDFGTYGKTFHIQEQNILEYLRQRLLTASLEEQELVSKKLIQLAKEPKPLRLPNAMHHRCLFYDPTVTAKAEIQDEEGQVIVKKGATYNPLDNHRLTANLLFFDATQKCQLDWAKAEEGVWILVKGKPLELEQAEGHPVYFDQFGYLTTKLGIKAIPARVSQENKLLKVEEIPVEMN